MRWYLDAIENNALIRTRSDNRFEITPKGRKYLEVVSELEKLMQFD